jgi:amidohydrolase
MHHLIQKLSDKYFLLAKEVRNHLHQYPELSFQEFNTAAYISDKLRSYNIPHKTGIAKTGIVGEISGKKPNHKLIALRADIDALPIEEKNNHSYCSKNNGVMHACGHDAHTAILLATVCLLHELKEQWEGTIRFIFQPGEEKLPGGASLMIEEGVLANPKPDAIVGLHVFPEMEFGHVGFKKGMYMASTDELYLKVIGKGGHAALPMQYNNPLVVSAAIITALNNYFMNDEIKKIPDNIPTVLAFGKINSLGGATNVIPDTVELQGTFRTMSEEWRERAHQILQDIVTETANQFGARAELNIIKGYPFLVNDEKITDIAQHAAAKILGADKVHELNIRMTAEDFAWYTHHVPACFLD